MTKYSKSKLIRRVMEKEIHALKSIDLKTVDEKYLERLVGNLLGHGYIDRIPYIQDPKAIRVRINDNDKLFENVKELWWPPAEVVQRGRCNDPGQPIFYFADSEETAIIEKQPVAGDVITVLTSELVDPGSMPVVMIVGIHEFTGKTNPRYGLTPREKDAKQKQFIRREGLSKIAPLLHDYVREEFLRDVREGFEFEYKITSTIARHLITRPEIVDENGNPAAGVMADGIAYPSIRADKFGVNVALKTESADRLYGPVGCVAYRILEAHERFPYTVGKLCWSKSITPDGQINWEIPKSQL
jgi:hypothetical protein